MLEKKAKDLPQERIQESIKLLLILDNEVSDSNFSKLINLIGQNESY